jgi:hypothetical protein
MDTLQRILLVGGLIVQLLLILAGLRRENLRISYLFLVYLCVGFLSSIAVSYLIESNEGRRLFYIVKELLLDVIKVGLLVELNRRIFRSYPRVRRSNFFLFVWAGLFLLIYIWLFPPEKPDWWGAIPLDLHSKVMQTTCFIFFVFAGSVLFYRLQIDTRHKYLLLGFLFSQFPLALGYALMATFGEAARPFLSLLNSVFFVLALFIWMKVYFRRDQTRDSMLATHPGLDLPHDSRQA